MGTVQHGAGCGGNGRWRANRFPTTAFRHDARASAVHADGSASAHAPRQPLEYPDLGIGSITPHNDPSYIPDWRDW